MRAGWATRAESVAWLYVCSAGATWDCLLVAPVVLLFRAMQSASVALFSAARSRTNVLRLRIFIRHGMWAAHAAIRIGVHTLHIKKCYGIHISSVHLSPLIDAWKRTHS